MNELGVNEEEKRGRERRKGWIEKKKKREKRMWERKRKMWERKKKRGVGKRGFIENGKVALWSVW